MEPSSSVWHYGSRRREHERAAVEHAVVGKYRFPLFSHPAFRAKAADDRVVAEHVDAVLRNPELFAALNAYAEQMLAQGKTSVTDEDVDALLQLSVPVADTGFATPTASPSPPSPLRYHLPQSQQQQHRRCPPYFSQRFTRNECCTAWRPTEARTHRLVPIAADALQKTSGPVFHVANTEGGGQKESSSAARPLATHHSRVPATPLLPTVVSTADLTPSCPPSAPAVPQEAQSRSSREPLRVSQTHRSDTAMKPTEGDKDFARVVAYSLLQRKLAAPHHAARLREMDRARALQGALDSQQLHSLSPHAYATLDVSMDGNSSCLRRRQQPATPTPTQLTNMLLTQGHVQPGCSRAAPLGKSCATRVELSRTSPAAPSSLSSAASTRAVRGVRSSASESASQEKRLSEMHRRGRRIAKAVTAAESSHGHVRSGTLVRRPISAASGTAATTEPRLVPCVPEEEGDAPSSDARGESQQRGIPLQLSWHVGSASANTGDRSVPAGQSGLRALDTALEASPGVMFDKKREERSAALGGGSSGGGVHLQATQLAAWEKALLAVRRSAV